ncbi:MAG: hypothetical protein M3507_08910 [Actinomycetota bacterium]|jgi:hypothetical protein|nr:hypothetical protein [Actinomycetota bacterium]
MASNGRERVILARRTTGFQPFQWTGDEPEALNEEDEALALGALWEGDELVTYDFSTLALKAGSDEDDFLNDND